MGKVKTRLSFDHDAMSDNASSKCAHFVRIFVYGFHWELFLRATVELLPWSACLMRSLIFDPDDFEMNQMSNFLIGWFMEYI